MELSKRRKICFGILLALFTMVGSLSNVCSVFAESVAYTGFSIYVAQQLQSDPYCNNYNLIGRLAWNENFSGCRFSSFAADTSSVMATGSFWFATGKFNIVRKKTFDNNGRDTGKFINVDRIQVLRASHNTNSVSVDNYSIQTYLTSWSDSIGVQYETLTVSYNASGHGATQTSGEFRITMGSVDNAYAFYSYTGNPLNNIFYFENSGTRPTLSFSGSFDDGSTDTIINQNNTIINQGSQLNQMVQNHYGQENQAYDDISNQSSSDIQGATNQQTTNLIGFIASFVSALSSAQASNCELTLPFPNFAGGSKTVNVCDGKQYAPSLIAIGGSLLLIGTFVPLAFIVLRMIYNEIRSWTNG